MTRDEWKSEQRKIRVERLKEPLAAGVITGLLRELYSYSWTEKQQAYIKLVERYKDRLPQRYQDQIEAWRPEAKERAKDLFQSLLSPSNPFLEFIKKSDDFSGKYVPVPFIFGQE